MWKNIVGPGRPLMAIWHIACWVTKAADTHSEYVIIIVFTLSTIVARTRLSITL